MEGFDITLPVRERKSGHKRHEVQRENTGRSAKSKTHVRTKPKKRPLLVSRRNTFVN